MGNEHQRTFAFASLALTLATGCLETDTALPETDAAPPDGPMVHHAPPIPPCELSTSFDDNCEEAPELCGLSVESVYGDPALDLETAVDVVFIGDAFTEGELEIFGIYVDGLIEAIGDDEHGIVARAPTLFNFHRVDVVTDPRAPETPLRVCGFGDDSQFRSHQLRVELAARNAPDADVIVVVANSWEGRANASSIRKLGLVHTSLGYFDRTLTHELAHALFGLEDEYVEIDACWARGPFGAQTMDETLAPNVTMDPTGAKWSHLVDTPPLEGAMLFSSCVYRPTDDCRMLDSSEADHFCPVCDHHIDTALAIRRDAMFDDGPPSCGLLVFGEPDVFREGGVLGFGHDRNGMADVALYLDAVLLEAERADWGWGADLGLQTLRTRSDFVEGDLAAGTHEIRVVCTDHLGSTAEDRMTLVVPED